MLSLDLNTANQCATHAFSQQLSMRQLLLPMVLHKFLRKKFKLATSKSAKGKLQHVPKLVIASLLSWPLLLSPF